MRFSLAIVFIGLPILTATVGWGMDLDTVRERTRCGDSAGTAFSVTGQIGLICDSLPQRICLIDSENEHMVAFWETEAAPERGRPRYAYEVGDVVRLDGVFRNDLAAANREIPNSIAPCFTNLTVVTHGAPLPKVERVTAERLAVPKGAHRFVEIGGVVCAVQRDETNEGWNWIILRTGKGKVRAAATEHDYPYDRLIRLLDVYTILRGSITPFVSWRKFLGRHLVLFGKNGVVPTETPPDPFDAPPLTNEYQHHRQQTHGVVIGLGPHTLYMQDDAGRFLPVTPLHEPRIRGVPAQDGAEPYSLGDAVTASGFVELGPMSFQIDGALIRRENRPRAPLPSVIAPDPARMFNSESGNVVADARLYGKTIRLHGRIANTRTSIDAEKKIHLVCGAHTFSVEVAHLTDRLPDGMDEGAEAEVTGICIGEFGTDVLHAAFPAFEGFKIVPRIPDDIRIVARPPWWTPFRLMGVIALLAALLIVILLWNRSLSILSERRGRALYREQIAGARAKLKVDERTRLAVELHDSISQTLTGVAYHIDAAAEESAGCGATAVSTLLTTARQMLASCRQELRCCLWDLRSRTFEEKDMTEAVRRTLAPFLGPVAAHVRFNVRRDRLSDTQTHTILRIIRELAVNAIRHGHATQIRIAGECQDGFIRFSIRDNGCGFDTQSVPGPSEGHFGLQGVRERAAANDGTVEIESAAGAGTRITVTLKLGVNCHDE